MNNDIHEIIMFVSDEIAKFRGAWTVSGVLDDANAKNLSLSKAEQHKEDKAFEHMLKIRLDFLCEDSSLSLEVRKAALHYETQEIVNLLERVSRLHAASQMKEKLLNKVIKSCGEEHFIPNCHRRAVMLERVLNQTLDEQIQNKNTRSQKI